ncbi:MAG: tRNA (N(6)-L-threonylcarbamoyladenosine(37)-C(2))-methylthiotransferase MtaB, partial [Muribaculaceae bacterium]|nr:tRNA (N(6)-L-threonylcarbamoyladenosine(37)-C(2))-methylthiotransferase MtaB [Muribaculaceae bacterium]
IELIARRMPDAFIGIDVIAGARGETDEEFERSLRFIESLPITRLHVFPYSERPGTKALEIDYVVPPQVKHERVNRLLRLSEEKLHAYAARFIGTVRPVLFETPDADGVMTGHTDNYLKVRVPGVAAAMENRIAPVRLLSVADTDGEDIVVTGEPADTLIDR